jgi:hypothetical protein
MPEPDYMVLLDGDIVHEVEPPANWPSFTYSYMYSVSGDTYNGVVATASEWDFYQVINRWNRLSRGRWVYWW